MALGEACLGPKCWHVSSLARALPAAPTIHDRSVKIESLGGRPPRYPSAAYEGQHRVGVNLTGTAENAGGS
jgi:hypothetical protein